MVCQIRLLFPDLKASPHNNSYDSSWLQSEIKRVANIDGVKIPITVAERSSLLSFDKEKPKNKIPKPNAKKPQIFSVSLDKNELTNGGVVTMTIKVSSLTPIAWNRYSLWDPNGKDLPSESNNVPYIEGPRNVWTRNIKLYRISEHMPSGKYKITSINVENAARVNSGDWKEMTIKVDNSFALDK